MFLQSAVCVLLVGVVLGRPHPDTPPQYAAPPPPAPYHPPPHEKEDAKPYAFNYGVKDDYTGAQYGHTENSDGQAVQGSYSVALPDGRIQTVKYVADHHNGFQAQVSYEGEASYPDTHQASYPHPPSYPSHPQPPVYNPPVYPSAKEEEFVDQQVVYEPVDLPDTVYRDQMEDYA